MKIELFNEDCMSVMSKYPDGYFDICFTSPPYNMNLRVNQKGDGYCSRQVVSNEFSSKYHGYSDNLPMQEYEDFLFNIISELIRVCGVVFFNIQMVTGNKPALFRIMGRFSDQIKEVIIWDKVNAQPAIGQGVMNSGFEFILVFGGRPITRSFSPSFDRGTVSNIVRVKKERSSNKKHKAVFPRELASHIFRNFSNEGAKVIDPFMGTGTSAIESFYSGASEFVGCEIVEDYLEDAKLRISEEISQGDMFND